MGCADVCIDHGYDEQNEFFSTSFPTARKPWKCVECGWTIPKGAKYERSAGKSDGDMWSHPTCLPCAEIREAFVCGSFIFSMLWESIEESIFPRWDQEGPFDCLAKLTTQAARNFIQARYEEWKI